MKKHEDENQIASRIVATVTEFPKLEKNPAAVTLGRLGGLKGGKARADKLSPRRRKEIAKAAAKARWAGRTKEHK
jgi:hypothetical protein